MKLKFIEKKKEAGDSVSFIFSAKGGSSFGREPVESISWKAGQFLIYFLPHEEPDVRGKQRFFTISSAPFEKHVMLTTRIFPENKSSFKKALEELKPGGLVDVKGPDGDFIIEDPNKNFVFIAGGIGITPYHSIIKQLNFEQKPLNIELLYANKTDEFVFKDELEQISSTNPNFKITYIISPQHVDQKYIRENVQDIPSKRFYVSGPEPMVESLYEMLKGMGIKEENIKTDYFPGYEAI